MDANTAVVIGLAFATSFLWLPILLFGIAAIVSAWRGNTNKGDKDHDIK